MTWQEDIAAIPDLLYRLKQDDVHFRVFGSRSHRYRLRPVLNEQAVSAYEQRYAIALPPDYRAFLTTIGNGGAGPYLGLLKLEDAADGSALREPFSYTRALTQEESEALEELNYIPGILDLSHMGCGMFFHLVVSGPAAGMVLDDNYAPTGLSFSVWYRAWLERVSRQLANERLLQRIKVGMTQAQALAAVGGVWREWPAPREPHIFLSFPDIPGRIELNAERVVIAVHYAPLI